MTVSTYLSKKYYAYSKDTLVKSFTPEHVAFELQLSSTVAGMTIGEILGKGYLTLNYFQFEEVVCTTLDLE